jgi:hypothetical protein
MLKVHPHQVLWSALNKEELTKYLLLGFFVIEDGFDGFSLQ